MTSINHVFVLMLENRSFDHMLGFSGITGKDAVTDLSTSVDGLTGSETNSYQDTAYKVSKPADFMMTVSPGHEFPDVLEQLSGQDAKYAPGGQYPPINESGYVTNFVQSGGKSSPGDIMKCFDPSQLPVLTALASNFVVCDNWFSSLPGPTWPNRFFMLAASSSGLDHSPTPAEMIQWETLLGFKFQNGSIFDRKISWRIYAEGDLCLAHALSGIHFGDITPYSHFSSDINSAGYPAQFTLIEPNYGHVATDYKGGTSQHPLDDVSSGETLIKTTYEAIRNSPIWNTSLLIVTWDEHGGFYDHAAPLPAIAPGDAPQFISSNKFGFNFKQYGTRVPAIIISPLIPGNLIDRRIYDHSSVPATVEQVYKIAPMTQRDAQANHLLPLVSLTSPRADTPTTLPSSAKPTVGASAMLASAQGLPAPPATRPQEAVGSCRAFSMWRCGPILICHRLNNVLQS
jgi:phospholipase C